MCPRSLLLVLAALLGGCLSPFTEAGGHPFAAGDDGLVSLDDDPRIVLRDRITLGDDEASSFVGEPFSLRARRWHVYPFTVYGPTRFTARLRVDTLMGPEATIWVLGPRQSDGRWPISAPSRAQGFVAEATGEATGHGQWALLVGPASAQGFAPRYPSRLAYMRAVQDDVAADEPELARIDLDETPGLRTRAILRIAGEEYEIQSPLPGNEDASDPAAGARFEVLGPDGPATFVLDRWWIPSSYVTEDGTSVLGNLGAEGEGVLETYESVESPVVDRWLVLESVGTDGRSSSHPMMLRVVPEAIEGRRVEIRACAPAEGAEGEEAAEPPSPDETAVEDRCVSAVLTCPAEDETCLEAPVPEEAIVSFRSTFRDPTETSTYDLEVVCDAGCGDLSRAAGQAVGLGPGLPRYPVYFGHGFNSSSKAWQPTLEALRASDPRWNVWADAQDVPPFEPVKYRAEALRRNLLGFLARLRAHGVDTRDAMADPRFNLISHSKGGLDARVLMHVPEWNGETCGEPLCQDAEGRAQSCCPLDAQGRGVPWKNAIVSVTTLSTPHGGSSFADWGARLLTSRGGFVDGAFKLVARKFFGLDEAGQDKMRQTFTALSRRYSNIVIQPNVRLPTPERSYDWTCATRGCAGAAMPAAGHAPVRDAAANGGYRLPAPVGTASIFSWGAATCINGGCGDIVDPGLLVSFRHVLGKETGCDSGRNDGVVSACSARFGIFMGIRSNDHFRWTRGKSGSLVQAAAWLFGVKQEPTDQFYSYWLGELARAGY